MAALDLGAWMKKAGGTRGLVCPDCNKESFRLSWERVELHRRVRTAHRRRVVARCRCGWETRVTLGSPN